MGDIQTFVTGIDSYLVSKNKSADVPGGGGNLALTIVINTGLELAAALYQGKTKYSLGNGYNATSNVKQFVERFFPGSGRKIPLLLWDGIRNGIDHVFSPKAMKCSYTEVKFSFYVEDKRVPSRAIKN